MNATMYGTKFIPFLEMFRSTVETHGTGWACRYYSSRGMSNWELGFWLRAIDDGAGHLFPMLGKV